ncbi:MAG: hypothetical protein FJZ00_11330, partial [Candidatus Sericytochromatia bacterium]|nr:hypothetical protein [Candidatus Tanganyikabacteria bacterium]
MADEAGATKRSITGDSHDTPGYFLMNFGRLAGLAAATMFSGGCAVLGIANFFTGSPTAATVPPEVVK